MTAYKKKPGFYWFDRYDNTGTEVIDEWIVELMADGYLYSIGSDVCFSIVSAIAEDEAPDLAYHEVVGKLGERIERKRKK